MDESVLVLDRNLLAREQLAWTLEQAGYRVRCSADSADALALLAAGRFALVVADVGANADAIEGFVQALQTRPNKPAAIIVTREEVCAMAVAALRAGAADYLGKQASPEQLCAAVKRALARHRREQERGALLRDMRAQLDQMQAQLAALQAESTACVGYDDESDDGAQLTVGGLRVGQHRRAVELDGQSLPVTPIEYRLLFMLASTPGQPVGYQQLVQHTHGYQTDEGEAMALLKTHVRNLRRKLPHGYLATERSRGYLLAAQDHANAVGLALAGD